MSARTVVPAPRSRRLTSAAWPVPFPCAASVFEAMVARRGSSAPAREGCVVAAVEIPASELATAIPEAFCVDVADRASRAKASLIDRRFDQAPVLHDGDIAGWVLTSRLTGRGLVEGCVTGLRESVIVSGDASVGDVLRPVAERGLVFLAGRHGISSFIVASDFDRHAVRTHLYLRIAEIEILLAALVRATVPEDDVIRQLRSGGRKRFEGARNRGRETNAVEYLYLRDYAALVEASTPMREALKTTSGLTEEALKSLLPLRNCVAHPSKSLLGEFEPVDVVALSEGADWVLGGLRQSQARFLVDPCSE